MTKRPTKIADLKLGDLVDLEGDQYADPVRNHSMFEYSYIEVVYLKKETVSCIAVGFDGFDIVGFPPTHIVDVVCQ